MNASDPITPEMAYLLLLQWLGYLLLVPVFLVMFMPSVTEYGIVAGGLALVTLCARRQKGAGTFNGFGTKFYGNRRIKEGAITTKWVTLCHLPIVPIRSYFVYSGAAPISEKVQTIEVINVTMDLIPSQEEARASVCPLPRLFWPQVLPMLLVPLLILGVIPAVFHFVVLPPAR